MIAKSLLLAGFVAAGRIKDYRLCLSRTRFWN
jgi:hypothetical protein